MATYTDFIRQHTGDKARVRRLYWVYGEEGVFRNLVVDRVRELFDPLPFNVARVSAAEMPEHEIWALLNQHPIDTDHKRLIIVTEAQKLKNLEFLTGWLKDNQTVRRASATAVFVSTDHEWEDSDTKEFISKSSSASFVKCALPKAEDDRLKRAQDVITSWGNIDRLSAGVLAQWVNYNMTDAYGAMMKANVVPQLVVGPDAVRLLAPRRVEEDVVWSLLALNKRLAIEAIVEGDSAMSPQYVIGALATHVEILARLHTVLKSVKSVKDAAGRLGAKEQYVRRLYPCAKFYPAPEALRRTLLLTRLDASAQRGAKEGILESLVAAW